MKETTPNQGSQTKPGQCKASKTGPRQHTRGRMRDRGVGGGEKGDHKGSQIGEHHLLERNQRATTARPVSKSPARSARGRKGNSGAAGRQSRIDMLWQNLVRRRIEREKEGLQNSPSRIPDSKNEIHEGLVVTTCSESRPELDPPPGEGLERKGPSNWHRVSS